MYHFSINYKIRDLYISDLTNFQFTDTNLVSSFCAAQSQMDSCSFDFASRAGGALQDNLPTEVYLMLPEHLRHNAPVVLLGSHIVTFHLMRHLLAQALRERSIINAQQQAQLPQPIAANRYIDPVPYGYQESLKTECLLSDEDDLESDYILSQLKLTYWALWQLSVIGGTIERKVPKCKGTW